MLARYFANIIGQRGWIRPSPSVAAPTSRLLVLGASTQTHTQLQVRLSSGASGGAQPPYDNPYLSPPWRLENLTSWEREAYAKHGADYAQHLTSKQRKLARWASLMRGQLAARLERELGPDWFAIFHEANRAVAERAPVAPRLAELNKLDAELRARAAATYRDRRLSGPETEEVILGIRAQKASVRAERAQLKARADALQRQFCEEIRQARAAQAGQSTPVGNVQGAGEQADATKEN